MSEHTRKSVDDRIKCGRVAMRGSYMDVVMGSMYHQLSEYTEQRVFVNTNIRSPVLDSLWIIRTCFQQHMEGFPPLVFNNTWRDTPLMNSNESLTTRINSNTKVHSLDFHVLYLAVSKSTNGLIDGIYSNVRAQVWNTSVSTRRISQNILHQHPVVNEP